MRAFLMIGLALFTTAESAITLSGKAYLQGQTDHSGIRVIFTRTQPTTGMDSTITGADGSYSMTDSAGYYTISYSKAGFFVDSILETPYFSNANLADQTLIAITTRINVPSQFATIQQAITHAVDGDTVLVAPGTYKENIIWTGKNIILASQLILTNDTSYISNTIIDGGSNGANSVSASFTGAVLSISGVTSNSAMLYGFTITNGYSTSSGGGISCSSSSLKLSRLIISSNAVRIVTENGGGGGLALLSSNSVIDSVVFEKNAAYFPAGGYTFIGGSAIYCDGGSPIIQNCLITGQVRSLDNNGNNYATLFCITDGSTANIKNTEIMQNNLGVDGQALMDIQLASPVFENIKIHGNLSSALGINHDPGHIGGGSPTYKNMVASNNNVADGFMEYTAKCNSSYINCTFVNNTGGYVLHERGSNTTISNCIFSFNTGFALGVDNTVPIPVTSHNLFFNNSQGNFANCGSYLGKNVTVNANGDSADTYGNIQANPYFVNSGANNCHLADWSRSIGAGTATGAPATDIEGVFRGNPPDIGAYENVRNDPGQIPVPSVPILVAPANGAVNLNPDTVLQWNGDGSADNYQVQISIYSDLHSPCTDTTLNGSAAPLRPCVLLADNTVYYWRVRAANKGGNSNWSTMWSFKTAPIPLKPILVSPANNSTSVDPFAKLYWRRVQNATSYNIHVNMAGSAGGTTQVTDTFWSPSGPMGFCGYSFCTNTIFQWQVQAIYTTGTSNWTDMWSFQTAPFYAPSLSSPVNGSSGQPLNLQLSWYSISGASTYRLQLSTSSTFAGTVVDDSTSASVVRSVGPLAIGETYYWRVNAKSAAGTSAWSQTWSFVTIPPPAGVPTLISPSNDAANQSLAHTLTWNAISSAATYRIQFSADSTFFSTLFDDSTLTDTTKAISSLLTSVKYFWRVRSKNAGGISAWSTVWHFTTIPAAPSIPVLVSPTNGAANQPLNFSLTWNAAAGASTYWVQLSTSFTFAGTVVDDSTMTSALRAIGPLTTSTTYYWRINAKNAGGTSAWSDIWSFSTVPPVAGAPVLVSPTNSAVNQPLTLTLLWAAISGASTYRVQFSTSSTFVGTVVDDSTLTSTLRLVGPLSNGTTYYWHVNAKSAGGTSAWSETWTFTTVPPPTAAPTLVSPSNAAINQPLSLPLTWNAVTGAVTYRVQLSTSSAFTGTVIDDSMITTPSVPVGPLSSNSTYYWRVNTSDAGGASAWSTQWSFTTIPPVPNQVSLVSPSNESVIPIDSVALSWNKSSPGIDKFCLEIFTDSFMNGRLLIDSTINDTSRIQKNLQNKTSYWWRVTAHNIAGWGAPSVLSKFTMNIPVVAVLPKKYSCVLNGMSRLGSTIKYGLPVASNVSIKLFNVQGKLVKMIRDTFQQPGYYQVNICSSDLSRGCYLLDFRAGNYLVKKKINNL
jgi:hypothetical protein